MHFLAFLRKKLCTTLVTMAVIIPVVNVSVDPTDPVPHLEDLTINEIESCLEWVLEVGFGHTDAIQETDDHDQSTHKPAARVVLFSDNYRLFAIECSFEIVTDHHADLYTCSLQSPDQTIISPPPKCG